MKDDIEVYIKAAQNHGEDSEPDHEVGDLQDLLRLAWSLMNDGQKATFRNDDVALAVLACGGMPLP